MKEFSLRWVNTAPFDLCLEVIAVEVSKCIWCNPRVQIGADAHPLTRVVTAPRLKVYIYLLARETLSIYEYMSR